MPKLVPVSGKKMIKILENNNFSIIRTSDSHNFLQNLYTKKTTVVPIHGNEDLGRGLLKQILRDIDISVNEFENMRNK